MLSKTINNVSKESEADSVLSKVQKIAPQAIGKRQNLWRNERWPGFYKINWQKGSAYESHKFGNQAQKINHWTSQLAGWRKIWRQELLTRRLIWSFSQQCSTAGWTSQSICRRARSPDLLWPRSKKSPLRTSIPNLGQVFPAWDKTSKRSPLRTSIPSLGQISLSSKNAREECRDRRSHSRIRNSALTARHLCSASISTMQLSFSLGPQLELWIGF